MKLSVEGAHADSAFDFMTKEDGESAADWHIYNTNPSGLSVSAVTDTDRHPDGEAKVIQCLGGWDGSNGNCYVLGDNGVGITRARRPGTTPTG